MQKFLFVKPAFIENETQRYDTGEDILSLEQTLIKIYRDIDIDICSVTEDNEWLIHGRKISTEIKFKNYNRVFIFVHNIDNVIDIVKENIKLFANKYTYLYKAEDKIFHHGRKLEEIININNVDNLKIKFPVQKHINIKKYNEDAITTVEIVSKHMRELFLPIHTLPTHHAKHKAHKDTNPSYNAKEFIENIDKLRHTYDELTFREYIEGIHVYIAIIPDYKNQDFYLCLPLVLKKVNNLEMFEVANLLPSEKEDINKVALNISKICFSHQPIVLRLSVHKRRGVFVEHTSPLLTYLLHYPDFVFESAGSLGLDIEEFVDKIFG